MTKWLNGEFCDDPKIAADDRGFLIGDGVFETVYAENGRCAFLGAHIARLEIGLAMLEIAPPRGLAEAAAVIAEVAARDGVAGPAAARITVTRGAGVRGLRFGPRGTPATMLVSLSPMPAGAAGTLRLRLSSRIRYSNASANAFKATGGYLESMLAHNEALRAGADEALLLNEHGRVACAAAANVFIIGKAGAATPPPGEGAMAGVVRGLVLERARALGLPVEERAVGCEELAEAAIFLTNSLIGLRPAVMQGTGDAPPASGLFADLQTWYEERLAHEVGRLKRQR